MKLNANNRSGCANERSVLMRPGDVANMTKPIGQTFEGYFDVVLISTNITIMRVRPISRSSVTALTEPLRLHRDRT